jgi:4-hydroxythreonine-4-phosphate dehydrogenase
VTLGDPAGIGPEVTEKACERFVREAPDVELTLHGPAGLADVMAERLRVRARALAPFAGTVGRASAHGGAAALAALGQALAAAKAGEVDALVTAPISKEALALAGSSDRGHTEILARELGLGPTAMAFFSEKLRVVLATTHIPLAQVPGALTPKRLVEVARLLSEMLARHFAMAHPRLALCGLNPHAGEGGLLGREDLEVLTPAVAAAQQAGIDLQGPFPADTLFHRAATGAFDGVVANYHDQGLIPVKLIGFGEAVNVTLGLRLPRTSPDHGTAFDIAGQGKARPDGMLQALRLAARLAGSPR